MIERILIAHDGSDSARKAFDFAVDLAVRTERAPHLRADLARLDAARKSLARVAG
jgi:nucleotide-binding universal stress UspA family protein